MKNLIKSTKILLCLAIFSFGISCQKEKETPESIDDTKVKNVSYNKDGIGLTDGIMDFKTVADYDNATEMISNNTYPEIAGFQGMGKVYAYDVVRSNQVEIPEFLQKILNKDQVVKIGEWLFKMNFNSQKVYALKADLKNENYKDLVKEDSKNAKIRVFDFEDPVLDILEEEGQRSWPCRDSRAEQKERIKHKFTHNIGGVAYQYHARLKYCKLGIYFWSYAEFQVTKKDDSNVHFHNIELEWHRKYKPRCKDEHGWQSGSKYGSPAKYSGYHSTRALQKYHYWCDYKINGTIEQTLWIKDGY